MQSCRHQKIEDPISSILPIFTFHPFPAYLIWEHPSRRRALRPGGWSAAAADVADATVNAAARPAIEAQWRVEQSALQRRMVAEDAHSDWRLSSDSEQGGDAASPAPGLRFVGGCDISFIKGNEVDALAMVVVLSFPELEVVHEVSAMVKLTAPYIPGFLAFREAPHLVALLERIKAEKPELFPQVLFVDGNGMLHPKASGWRATWGCSRTCRPSGWARP